jgi:hypothetical protein
VSDLLSPTPPAGPEPASWVAAGLRGLHPLRWGLALAGLGITAVVAALFQALFTGDVPRFVHWFEQPTAQVESLASHLGERSFAGLAVRLGALLAVAAAVLAVVGCWIARHELLARLGSLPDPDADANQPGPTALVVRRVKSLALCFVAILAIAAVVVLPVALVGLVNRLGGAGAILVAILLPVVLVADLILLLVAGGVVAWPLMPVTLAAENSDTFDALSRAYNYLFTRPVRFLLLAAVSVAVAAVPTVAALAAVGGPVENWLAASGHPAVWAAAALSASVFWSLQTLVYLQMRTTVDAVDANELVREPQAPTPAERPPVDAPAKPKPARGPNWWAQILLVGAMVATWLATVWLFARLGGENTAWLGWGTGDRFRPPAEGLYSAASLLAGAWGAIWIAAVPLLAVRRAVRASAAPTTETADTAAIGDQQEDRTG